MENLSHYAVILLNMLITIRYCYLTIRRKINPSLAMWLFFTIAVTGSLFSYLMESNFSPWDNILNTTDIILCGTISLAILIFGDSKTRFNRFDIGCLAAVLIILLFWFFSRAHFATHLSLQMIQVIAYFPVIRKMLKAGENTESFFTWICIFLVSAISLVSSKGVLASVYAIRAMVCASILLFLMIRIERKNKSPNMANQNIIIPNEKV